MSAYELTPPEPARRLFVEILDGRSPKQIAATAADGIQAILENIDRLLSDIDFLLADKRYATASFLLATAQEELAKLFILIDMCRLDPTRHQGTLRSLCKAFYNHVTKHAYNEIRRMPILHGMGQAADLWRTAVRRWWPESPNPEDAEPPMPHDTVFEREVPLYVDWDYWAKRWAGPTQSTNIWRFDNAHLPSELDRLRAEFHAVKDAAAKGLLCGRALETLHDIYSSTYINESTPAATVRALEDKLVAEPSLQLAVADAEIRSSPLLAPALYHFTTFPPDAA